MNEPTWMGRLCAAIDMPQEVTEILLGLDSPLPRFSPDTAPEDWDAALASMKAALAPDEQGLKLLAALLASSEETWKRFEALGMDFPLFCATMGCFSRFVREHRESFGCWGFDREWWVPRQLTCRLFRIGLLEYELTEEQGRKVVSLHIPSGAKLHQAELRASWLRAKDLIDRSFPLWRDAPMVCRSWLMSPALKELLPPPPGFCIFKAILPSRPCPRRERGICSGYSIGPTSL